MLPHTYTACFGVQPVSYYSTGVRYILDVLQLLRPSIHAQPNSTTPVSLDCNHPNIIVALTLLPPHLHSVTLLTLLSTYSNYSDPYTPTQLVLNMPHTVLMLATCTRFHYITPTPVQRCNPQHTTSILLPASSMPNSYIAFRPYLDQFSVHWDHLLRVSSLPHFLSRTSGTAGRRIRGTFVPRNSQVTPRVSGQTRPRQKRRAPWAGRESLARQNCRLPRRSRHNCVG